MSIVKTKLITISSNLDKLDETLMKFIDLEDFHPVFSSKIVETVHGLTSFSPDNVCTGMLSELAQLEREFKLDLSNQEVRSTDYDFEKFHQTITKSHNLLKEYLEKIKEDQALIIKYQGALTQVKNIESLDISLDDIFSCRYVYARVGRLPSDSIEKLKYYRNRPFVFKSFSNDQNFSWCMYFVTAEYEREVDNIFSSLFFERIHIPNFVHGTPEKAETALQTEIDGLNSDIATKTQELRVMTEDYGHRLGALKGQLLFLNRIFEAKRYVVGLGDRFTISGFTEVANVDKVKSQFEGIEDLEIDVRPPGSDKRITPPTKLKNGWFSRPFSIFVEMYGVPAYGGIDPTPFFAITYCLLFGVMFGDLGQGLLLALFGLLLAKWKKSKLGEIAIRIGLFSAFFGLLYGSFFGNEEILTPFYTEFLHMTSKPIAVLDSSSTMTLLIGAIAIGAFLIVLSIGMRMYANLKKKKYVEFFFSHNGVAGLIFYCYILTALAISMLGIGNILTWPFLIPFIGVPLIMIFIKEPIARKHEGKKMFPSGFGGFIMEGFFELFDVILSYVTNTMSFMRIGGFILSHAGMMLVVTSLMTMVGNGGWIVAIFGNLFVMLLEGLLVGIQVLRLEYYEMFSRYYDGDGIAFQTIKQ